MVIQRVSSATPNFSKDVLYFGSAVPLETSEGIEAVQQPLRSRYPVDGGEVQGIMSTLNILPEGIQLRYKADTNHVVMFPYTALSMCAAVRCCRLTGPDGTSRPRFVSLSSPEAQGPNANKPSIFTAITRRTKGRQVLECHGFITVSAKDALDLVQWVSMYDRRVKQGSFSTMNTTHNQSATYETAFKGDTSFSSSLPDFPIQLTTGEPVSPNAPQAFYNEPPASGYFYSTKNAQVKNYSLHKFSGGDGGGGGGGAAVSGAASAVGVSTGPPLQEPVFIPPPAHSVIGAPTQDNFERRAYAASVASAPAFRPMSGYGPRPPVMVHGYRPQPTVMMRPVMVPGPPPQHPQYSRGRFFSPPPPPPQMMRARPVPVFVAAPPPPMEAFYGHPPRRGSRGSSRSSSEDSSSPNSPRVNGRHHSRRSTHQNGLPDDSSETSSRPRTPPTDYDGPRRPRVSRREDFFMKQHWARQGSPVRSPSGKHYRPPPPGMYMMPPQFYPPQAAYMRPRSVPPYGEFATLPARKDKKSKKSSKKEKKRKSKKGGRGHGDPNESSDSFGYTSELNPNDSRKPRDFRRMENQFQHERAFSKSLAEETRRSTRNGEMNAYRLNNVGEGEYALP